MGEMQFFRLLTAGDNINLNGQFFIPAAGSPLAGTILIRKPAISDTLHQKAFAD